MKECPPVKHMGQVPLGNYLFGVQQKCSTSNEWKCEWMNLLHQEVASHPSSVGHNNNLLQVSMVPVCSYCESCLPNRPPHIWVPEAIFAEGWRLGLLRMDIIEICWNGPWAILRKKCFIEDNNWLKRHQKGQSTFCFFPHYEINLFFSEKKGFQVVHQLEDRWPRQIRICSRFLIWK